MVHNAWGVAAASAIDMAADAPTPSSMGFDGAIAGIYRRTRRCPLMRKADRQADGSRKTFMGLPDAVAMRLLRDPVNDEREPRLDGADAKNPRYASQF